MGSTRSLKTTVLQKQFIARPSTGDLLQAYYKEPKVPETVKFPKFRTKNI